MEVKEVTIAKLAEKIENMIEKEFDIKPELEIIPHPIFNRLGRVVGYYSFRIHISFEMKNKI